MKLLSLILSCILFTSLNISGQQTVLDSTFGTNGKVTSQTYTGISRASAIQTDGKIIVAGNGGYGTQSGFLLVRYTSNGNLDASFGDAGRTVTRFSDTLVNEIYAIAVLSTGKIIAAGGVGADIAIARYKSNGKIDSAFGNNGKVITDLGKYEFVTSLAIQSDGKMLVAGYSKEDNQDIANPMIVRYNANGNIDNSFGNNGKVLSVFDKETEINGLALQSDGKILMAGTYSYLTGTSEFIVARYLASGTPDSSFGISGLGKISFDNNSDGVTLNTIKVQSDDKILVAGIAGEGYGPYHFAMARYAASGSVDGTFGTGGKVITPFFTGAYESEINNLLIQSDNKIIATGFSYDSLTHQNGNFALARYNTNGSLDASFGNNGLLTTTINSFSSGASSVLQTDEKIIVAGNSTIADSTKNIYFALARYKPASGSNFARAVKNISSNSIKSNLYNIRLYPNPAKDIITIEGLNQSLQTNIYVTDIQGKLIKQINVKTTAYSFSISQFAAGTYIIKINDGNTVISEKFIKN